MFVPFKYCSPNPSLRFGLNLCDEEERFLYERKLRIFKGIHHLLKDLPVQGPQNPDQVRDSSKMNQNTQTKVITIYPTKPCSLTGMLFSFTVPENLFDDFWWRVSSNDCLLWCL